MRAQFVFQEVWTGLRRNLTMTVALVVVVAISLSLLGTGLLFVKQVDNTRTYWQGRVQLSIYLCTTTSVSPQCKQNGAGHPGASRTQICHDLRALLAGRGARLLRVAGAGVRAVQAGLLPGPVVHQPGHQDRDPRLLPGQAANTQADYSIVAGTVQGRPGVDQVVDDASILSKFYALLDGARNAVVIIAVILIIAAILLVANTIRLSAFNRRRETSIMRLVGASNFYVQLPFLVEGILAGLVGWLIAAGLLIAVKMLGLDSLQQYFPYNVELVRGRPRRGHRAGHGDGGAAVWGHLLPHAHGATCAREGAPAPGSAAAAGAKERTVIARNRRARHDYHIEDVVEGGLVLTGTEVKSLRAGRASLTDGFAPDL